MKIIPIEIRNGMMPTKGSEYAAAYDVYVPEDFELTGRRHIIPLGFCIGLPIGWKANIRPRSGYSAKGMEAEVRTLYRRFTGEEYTSTKKVRIDADVLLGLIDSDFRDEVGVIIRVNTLDSYAPQLYDFDTIVENHVYITKGTRIAQMEISKSSESDLFEVPELNRDIDRGGGFGHTNEQG